MVCAPLAGAQEWPLGGPSKECPAIGKLSGPRFYQAHYWTPPSGGAFHS
jgi:hypothetical protein